MLGQLMGASPEGADVRMDSGGVMMFRSLLNSRGRRMATGRSAAVATWVGLALGLVIGAAASIPLLQLSLSDSNWSPLLARDATGISWSGLLLAAGGVLLILACATAGALAGRRWWLRREPADLASGGGLESSPPDGFLM